MNANSKYVLIIIGAGGTGTYFLKEFARFIHNTNELKSFAGMHIFDGDVVEEKNLARQCFQNEDIGRNKASVMAEILNDAFGLNFIAHPTYITSQKQLSDLLSRDLVPVIIGCADNHGCRLLLEKFVKSNTNAIYFDSANEFETGEVVFSYRFHSESVGPMRSFYFPDIKTGDIRNREEFSCEELNNVSPQHIFTNMLAGNILLSGITNLLNGVVTPGFSYFNSHKYEVTFVSYNKEKK